MTPGKGVLYLIPVLLGPSKASDVLPGATLDVIRRLRAFVVEDAKSARQFLKTAGYSHSLQDTRFEILNEHTRGNTVDALLAPLLLGQDVGLMSDAGCPGVADPGEPLVRRALDAGVRVVPLVGPCSIILALMASGMNGQRFCFHGYLPVNAAQRARAIRTLEADSENATQIFIETPYRSEAMFQALLDECRPDTRVSLAADLTLDNEFLQTRSVADWKRHRPALSRRPVVFLVYRGTA